MKLIALVTAVIAAQTDEKCPEANRNVCLDVCASVSIRFFCFNLYYYISLYFLTNIFFFTYFNTLWYKFTMAREFVSLYRRNGGFNPAETGLQGNNEHICTMSPYYGESPVCKECVMSFFFATRYIWFMVAAVKKKFCSILFKLDIPFVIMSLTEMIFSNMNDYAGSCVFNSVIR